MTNVVEIQVVRADVTEVKTDMLLLKYARQFHGADEMVAFRLKKFGIRRETEIHPPIGEGVFVPTEGVLSSQNVLFVGTPSLRRFRYKEMRAFACRAIEIIEAEHPNIQTLTTTVHGAGYGLDIEESLHALVFGFQQAIGRGLAANLKEIVFVERSGRRFEIIRNSLLEIPSIARPASPTNAPAVSPAPTKRLDATNKRATPKPLAFVAMPFAQEFEDVYQFGIYGVMRRCGFVCERVDESYYAGSIIDRIREGIHRAEFVIADLTTERPNVYLEVGYAWGLEKPVILLARKGQKLHFDLSHHKCIFYPTIVYLAEELEKTVRDLFINGSPKPQDRYDDYD